MTRLSCGIAENGELGRYQDNLVVPEHAINPRTQRIPGQGCHGYGMRRWPNTRRIARTPPELTDKRERANLGTTPAILQNMTTHPPGTAHLRCLTLTAKMLEAASHSDHAMIAYSYARQTYYSSDSRHGDVQARRMMRAIALDCVRATRGTNLQDHEIARQARACAKALA